MNKLLCLTLGALLSTSVLAADVAKMAESCNGCHGKDGVSSTKTIPTIAGMSQKFLMSTFKAYKKKERPCAEHKVISGADKGKKTDMCKAVEPIADADLEALAKHYSEQKFVAATQSPKADLAAKGKEIHKANCEKCHSKDGQKPGDNAGFLGGQHMEYLATTLDEYQAGKRPMEKKMKAKMEKLTKEDLEALVNYYGSIK